MLYDRDYIAYFIRLKDSIVVVLRLPVISKRSDTFATF